MTDPVDVTIGSVTFNLVYNGGSTDDFGKFVQGVQYLGHDPNLQNLLMGITTDTDIVTVNFGLPSGTTLGGNAGAATDFSWNTGTHLVTSATINLDTSGGEDSIQNNWLYGLNGGSVPDNALAAFGNELGDVAAQMNPNLHIPVPEGQGANYTSPNNVYGVGSLLNDFVRGAENTFSSNVENYVRRLLGEPPRDPNTESRYPDDTHPHDLLPPTIPTTGTPPPTIMDTLEEDWNAVMSHGSPLVMDLSATGTGISLSSFTDDPVMWDIRSEGVKHASGWVSGDTGLLCIDLNSNGRIDDNSELFGDRPANGTTGTANGFQTLAAYDSNSDGVIDSSDAHFGDLLVWTDDNHDGVSQVSELHTLADLNITSIDLNYSAVNYDINDNTVKQESTFTMNGNTRTIADAWFAYDNVNTTYNGAAYTPDADALSLPDVRGYGLLPQLDISMSKDSTLLSLVQDLAGKTAAELFDPDYHLADKITAIMYQWAGVQDVDPDSRGGYFDAQKLGFLEHLMDQPLWNGSGTYPGGTVLPYVEEAWNDAYSLVATDLLAQSGLGGLLGNPVYDLTTDTLIGGAFTDPTILRFASPFSGSAITSSSTSLIDSGFNDIYVLQAGDAPIASGFQIVETANSGTNTLLLGGVSPSEVQISTDYLGNLFVQYTLTDKVEIDGAVDGAGASLIGQYMQQIAFDDGTVWDLTQGLTLSPISSGQALYGTPEGDTFVANGTHASFKGFEGDDTYVFSSGSSPASSSGDFIFENAGQGTDTIKLEGISESAVTMWDNSSGQLMIGFGTDLVTVEGGSLGGSGFAVGNVEQIVFDDSTNWDLTGGLNLVNNNTGRALYGTSYDDSITGGTGNDTFIGYGGNDTYVVASGGGSDLIVETAGQGTDQLLIHGVSPGDVKIWDNISGDLFIKYTSSDQVTIENGSWNSTTGFAAGSVEQIVFDDSTTWDLTGGLHLVDTNTGTSLFGGAGDDYVQGGTGAESLYGYGGNDTMIGGAGSDHIYGGTGNDTYSFSSGDGNDYVYENASEGTDTIALHGITPSNVMLYTNIYGELTIQYTSSDKVIVENGSWNSTTGFTAGSVDQIVFDDTTTWDLTGGLHLVDTNTGTALYGGAGDDYLQGGTGSETLYGYGGNDSMIGGAGSDNIYGGAGNDTYSFSSGAGTDIVHENASEGTDTIALHGVSTGDVRMWTDTSGNLMIKYTSSDQVTVVGGSYNSTTGVTIGSVEHVVFDDTTNWDLTSGLHLADASGTWWQGLYGTSGTDTLTSTGNFTSVYGYAGDDLLIANSGGANSSFTGGAGADTFRFMGTGVGATVTDFSTSNGDKIDIANLLTAYDPMSDTLSDFVHVTQSGSNTNVSVDIDGTGSGHSMTQIAILTGVTGLAGVDTLVANGTLIIA